MLITPDFCQTMVHCVAWQNAGPRGQIHAMFTAAGLTPGDTDLLLLPET